MPTTSTTYPSRLAALRLEILKEEALPEDFKKVPALFARWGLDKEPQECAWVVAYDSHMNIRTVIEVGRWSHLSVNIHLPTLLSAVLIAGCERFMLVHNHPTTSAKPSASDRRLTIEVMDAANACGLYFEDHVILTPTGKWFSFVGAGLLETVGSYSEHAAASR